MHTVALVTQKGGTGKSSLAVSLAVAAQELGIASYILDLDPQGTAKRWFERRESALPEVAGIDFKRVPAALAMLQKQGIGLVLIDTAGVDSPATNAATEAADLCLIPARPSIADIEAAVPTVRALMRLGRDYAFVLNQCPPGKSIRTIDAHRVLQLSGAVAGTILATRADHMDALAQGLGVTERDPAGKAAAEIRELLRWILTRMDERAHVATEKARFA